VSGHVRVTNREDGSVMQSQRGGETLNNLTLLLNGSKRCIKVQIAILRRHLVYVQRTSKDAQDQECDHPGPDWNCVEN